MDMSRAFERASIDADLMTWAALHGYALLGLRHPDAQGLSRVWAMAAVQRISRLLVQRGMFTEEELRSGEFRDDW